MWGTTFRYQDPISGNNFNNDGTNSNNPVVPAPTSDPVYQQYSSNYQINLLNSQSSITFKGKQYNVYSAVPQDMTIGYAYKNASQYYDPNSLLSGTAPIIDFTIPSTINGGNPSSLTGNQPPNSPQASPYNPKEQVYLISPPSDANSLFFIPNLPNTSGQHNGLTANIYFIGDPFKGKPGYWPDTSVYPNGTFHLTPYGWASNPTYVAKNNDVQLLNADGGSSSADQSLFQPTPILRNFWKHTIQGYDYTYQSGTDPNNPANYTVKRDIATAMIKAIQADANYPFPPGNAQQYLNWLVTRHKDKDHPDDPTKDTYTMNGIYFHVQPQPGFQRNLLRYYTAWGAVDVYNQASDLFMHADGTIELPAVQDSTGTWRYAPIVTQTWDGSQRYSLLNLTTGQVPSTYDDYPGYEYYLPGNVYLPGQAGVVTTYVKYLVQDNTGLSARQTDLWLGLKGDGANDILFWADAPVANQPTEPGGQGNKPYMFGASTYQQNSTWNYNLRLQSSNSFCVARLAQTDLQGKLYDASFYADLNNGKGYQRAATISYQWQPWTIDANGKWTSSPDSYGAGVPQLIFADTLGGNVSITASKTNNWNSGARVMGWSNQFNVDPSTLSQNNNLSSGLLYEYFATGTTSDPNTKYLIVLNPNTYWTSGSGDWGTASNWSSGVPGDFNNVYLHAADSVNSSVTYNNTAAAAPSLSMLRLDASGSGSMTLVVETGSPTGNLNAEMAIVGAAGKGNITQTAGTVTLTDRLLLGSETTGRGSYVLQGGTLNTANTIVGLYGNGTFTQSNGTQTISDTLTLAANSGSSGTYTLSGGTLTVNTIQQNSGGTLSHTGGTLNYTTWNHNGGTATFTGPGLSIGPNQTYSLKGGSLTTDSLNILTGGTFSQTGGTLNYTTLNFQGGGFAGDLVNTTLLTGTGPITGNVTNAGTVNPGNSPGTLNIVGSYTQAAGATYLAEVASPGSYDQISVTGASGTATLAGAIAPSLLGGYQPRGNQVFPGVVTATNGVTGAFSAILQQQISPTLFWQARYNPTSVDLWVQRNYTNSSLGLNSNQQGVGTMLNRVAGATSGDLDTVLHAIDYLPDSAGVRDAFKQISPEKAGALSNLGFAAATFQMRHLATRTTNLRFVQGQGGAGSGLTSGGLNFNYSKLDGLMLAYNGASLSNLFSARQGFQAPESRWGFYLDGGAAFGRQSASVNQTGYSFSLGGFTLGADYRVRDHLLVGLATGYSHTSAGFFGSGGRVNANAVPVNAYAAYLPGALYAYGSLGYALNLYDLRRNLNFNGITRGAASSTAGHQCNLYGEAGYDFRLSRFILTPSATLAYSGWWMGGFTEQGAGALNLKVGAQSADSLQSGLGGRVTLPLRAGSVKIVPQGYAFYQHEFANGSRRLNASLSQGGSGCSFQTDAAGRNYALVGASVTAALKQNLYAQINYNAEVGRGNATGQAVTAGLRYEF
jgi:uncharacterized protein with beta-barrel porin domain